MDYHLINLVHSFKAHPHIEEKLDHRTSQLSDIFVEVLVATEALIQIKDIRPKLKHPHKSEFVRQSLRD